MSKLKHTPGPWKYDDDPLRMRIHSEFDHDIVCHMVGNSASSMIQKREIKNANARLIAAAPEMIEVLINSIKESPMLDGAIGYLISVKNNEQLNPKLRRKIDIIERATGLTIEEVLTCTE